MSDGITDAKRECKPIINNKYISVETWKLPCRFHMTSDELKMILDPYFME